MGCEQLVQHAKVSKNRKFIPHFRENLARPLDKGGVGVVYLPCNPQSAASVREVINTANRLIHRVTAEVINPFQQLSTLYRHVVDTSPPPRAHRRSGLQPRRSIVPSVHSRTATRFTAEPQHCRPVSRCTAHRSTVLFASLRRFPAVPQHCRPAFRCTASLLHRSISVFFPLYRGTALPLLRFISVQRHCSTGLPFAALPLRRFAGFGPFCSKTLSCSLFFLFRDASPPLSRDVCLPGVGSGRLPGGLGNGAPDAAAALRSAPEIPFHILARAIPPPAVESRPLRLSRTGTQDGGAGRRRGKRRRSGRGEEEDMKGEERGKGAVGTLTWRGGATLPGRNSGEPRLGRTGPLTGRASDEPGP